MTSPRQFATSAAAIEHFGMGARQLEIVAWCTLTLLIDGLDLQLLAFAAPLLLQEWSISQSDLGQALSAVFFGMAIGNGVGGWLGDRLGRKWTILLSVAFFGGMTWATALVTNINQLIIMRFLVGIGFGAVTPCAIALVSEWTPAKHRSVVIGAVVLGPALGGVVGSAAAAALIEQHGWRFLFSGCGALTLAFLTVLAIRLVESPGYTEKSGSLERAQRLLSRVFGPIRLEPSTQKVQQYTTAQQRGSLRQLFDPINRRTNAGLFLTFFANSYIGFALLAWMPVVLASAGLPIREALVGSLSFNIASATGVAVGGAIAPRTGSRPATMIMVTGLILSTLALLFILGQPNPQSLSVFIYVFLAVAGLSSGALQTTLYALSSSAYALEYRATGIGVTSASSRAGGIVATLCGGLLLSAASDGRNSLFFMSLVLLAFGAVGGIMLFDKHWQRPSALAASAG